MDGLLFHTSDTGGLIFENRKKAEKVKYIIKNLCQKDYKVRVVPVGRKYQILTHPKLSQNDSWFVINEMRYI